MPEVSYQTTVAAPIEATWDFVREMDNWAPLLTGYQGHEKVDDKHSIWTLKGDVGILSREVRLDVHITEWRDAEEVSFSLNGLNEDVDGDGTFELRGAKDVAEGSSETTLTTDPSPGLFGRFLRWLAGFFFRLRHGKVERVLAGGSQDTAQTAQLRFRQAGSEDDRVTPAVGVDLDRAALSSSELDPGKYGEGMAAILAREEISGELEQARAVCEAGGLPLRVRLFLGPGAQDLHSLRWETMGDPRTPNIP